MLEGRRRSLPRALRGARGRFRSEVRSRRRSSSRGSGLREGSDAAPNEAERLELESLAAAELALELRFADASVAELPGSERRRRKRFPWPVSWPVSASLASAWHYPHARAEPASWGLSWRYRRTRDRTYPNDRLSRDRAARAAHTYLSVTDAMLPA